MSLRPCLGPSHRVTLGSQGAGSCLQRLTDMDFYHTPTTCAQATHILLREANLDFRAHRVDLASHTLVDGSDYRRVNPNGYVPAVVLDDGTVLTESVAILDWIATQKGELLPMGDLGRTRHLQMLAYLSTEVQKSLVLLFVPAEPGAQAWARETVPQRLNWIASRMEGRFLFGERFTGADAFLYVMLRWCAMAGVEAPAALGAFAARVERREAVRLVLNAEGVEPLAAGA